MLADLDKATLANRESPARRIGVILSILFLTSVGTLATMTSVPAHSQGQAEAQVAFTPLPSAAGY